MSIMENHYVNFLNRLSFGMQNVELYLKEKDVFKMDLIDEQARNDYFVSVMEKDYNLRIKDVSINHRLNLRKLLYYSIEIDEKKLRNKKNKEIIEHRVELLLKTGILINHSIKEQWTAKDKRDIQTKIEHVVKGLAISTKSKR